MLGENIESNAWKGELSVLEDDARDVTIRYVDGKLRDISQDDEFYTLIGGEWFHLDRNAVRDG